MTWEDWEDVLILATLNGSFMGFWIAAWICGGIEDYVKPKFLKTIVKLLKPIIYIILVPISGLGFMIWIVLAQLWAGIIWLVMLSPLILLIFWWF